jgi:hypothetical protein
MNDVARFKTMYGPPDPTPLVRAGLKKLGPRKWKNPNDFAKLCGTSTPVLLKVRDKFADYLVPVLNAAKKPAFIWAGSPEFAQELRKIVGARK